MTEQLIEEDQSLEDGLTPREEQEARLIATQGGNSHSAEAIALAFGAGFLWYRRVVKRRMTEEVTPDVSAMTLDAAIHSIWRRVSPMWVKMMTPTILTAYLRGARGVRAGNIPQYLLEQAAAEYAASMGEYLNSTSAHALTEGFTSYVNKKIPRRMAAMKAIEALGLTQRQMRSLVAAEKLSVQAMNTVVEQIPDSKAKRHIEAMLLDRAKKFGDNESFSATKQSKQIVWMWQQKKGKLPAEAYKMWVTARDEKVCPSCGPLHRKTVGLNEPFKTDLGEVWMPALHPNCRCDVKLRVPVQELLSKADAEFDREHPRDPGSGRFVRKPQAPRGRLRPVAEAPAPAVEQLQRELVAERERQRMEALRSVQMPEEEIPIRTDASLVRPEIRTEAPIRTGPAVRTSTETPIRTSAEEQVSTATVEPQITAATPVVEVATTSLLASVPATDARRLDTLQYIEAVRSRVKRQATEQAHREFVEANTSRITPPGSYAYIFAGPMADVLHEGYEVQILPSEPVMESLNEMEANSMEEWDATVQSLETERAGPDNNTIIVDVPYEDRMVRVLLKGHVAKQAIRAEAVDQESLQPVQGIFVATGQTSPEFTIPLNRLGKILGADREQNMPVYYELDHIHHPEVDEINIEEFRGQERRYVDSHAPFRVLELRRANNSQGRPIMIARIEPIVPWEEDFD